MTHEPRVRTIHIIEEYPDGSTMQIELEGLPLPRDDPHVRSRQGAMRDGVLSEVVTEFDAAQSRPLTYPVGLPFLENRAVWTTESPDGSVSPGARWLCSDPDALIAEVIAVSHAEGWSLGSPPTGRR